MREITVNEHGMASGVVYYDADGVEHFQPAEVVIVACNGIGTPRILLNSVSSRFPNGIANSSGLVGKNLMFHPYARIFGYFDDEMDGNRGPGNCIWSQEFYETDRSRGFVRGYTFEFSRGQGAVMAAVHGMATGRLPWGADHHRAYRGLFRHRSGMVAICEDLPEEHNTVTLDPVLKDSNGIPAPKIDYTLSENSRRMLDHAVARATEILRAAGAHDVGFEKPIADGGWHLMGTARMGTDPARSVVNEWGRSHDVKNLFIVDGSIFVTSAGREPDAHDPGAGVVRRRQHEAASGNLVRLIEGCSSFARVGICSDCPCCPCHCEKRSDEAIPCLTSRGTLVRQGIASSLRFSQ